MNLSKKQEAKLFKMFKKAVNSISFIILKNEPVLEEELIENTSNDVAKMIGKHSAFLQSIEGKLSDKDVKSAELILTENILNISNYVDRFQPGSNEVSDISSIALNFWVKSNIKAIKWKKK